MYGGYDIMGCFKRAEWRSGLTYRQTCRSCGYEMTYKDNILDFRPWFPDGFVYCMRCKSPLRHNELYAIDGPPGPVGPTDNNSDANAGAQNPSVSAFCSRCGKKFNDEDLFCSGCGSKR